VRRVEGRTIKKLTLITNLTLSANASSRPADGFDCVASNISWVTHTARGTHRLDGTQSDPRHGSCVVENLINLSKTVLKRYCVSSSTIE
jgi:hypothetical protein